MTKGITSNNIVNPQQYRCSTPPFQSWIMNAKLATLPEKDVLYPAKTILIHSQPHRPTIILYYYSNFILLQ